MTGPTPKRRGIARIASFVTGVAVMGLLAAGVIVLAAGLNAREPLVDRLPPPTPEDARYARVFLLTMEHIGRQPDREGTLIGTAEDFNGLFRILGRGRDDIRLRADMEDGRLLLAMSAQVPGMERLGWINVSAAVPPYSGRMRLQRLRVAGIPVPAGPAVRALAWAADSHFGEGAGTQALGMLPRLVVDDEDLTFDIAMPAGADRLLSRNAIAEIYGREMVSRAEVAAAATFLEGEVAAGRLQRSGSYAPWLSAIIAHAAEAPAEKSADAVMAGFMALNYLCGSDHFVSVLLPPSMGERVAMPDARPGCGRAGLRGRVDLRRHFTTAAAIKLISNRSAAVTAGEAKELYDMLHDGFDFTDVAANNSGIRLAMLLDSADPEEMRALAARIKSEDDVIIDLDGIPQIMDRGNFREQFGEVDSPAYLAMIAEIEARIDRLPIHSGGSGGGQEG